MFSGLNSLFRKVLPKRLFYRALLIVAVPVIVLQLIITIVFFDSLWIKTNKGMTRTLVNEISAFIEAYESEKVDKQEINNLFSLFLDLNIELKVNEELQKQLAALNKTKTCLSVPMLGSNIQQWLYQEAEEGKWNKDIVSRVLERKETEGGPVVSAKVKNLGMYYIENCRDR